MAEATTNNTLVFHESAKEFMLKALGKGVDEEGYIVELADKEQRVMAQDGGEIHITEFAGVRPGSQVFVKSDIASLVEASGAF